MTTNGIIYKYAQSEALKNAIALYRDSIVLFNNHSFSTSMYIAILSLEEIGKFLLLDDVNYHTKIGQLGNKLFSDYQLKAILNHYKKQSKLSVDFFDSLPSDFLNAIELEELNAIKNDSIYVGFNKNKTAVKLPKTVTKEMAIAYIKICHQILCDILSGVINDTYLFEVSDDASLFNAEQLFEVNSLWNPIQAQGK